MHAWDGAPGAPLGAEVAVRDARESDLDELLGLWRELMDLHVELDLRFDLASDADDRFLSYIDTAMHRDDYRVRVGLLGHRTVGFAVACVLPNSPVYRTRWIGYINDLCVTYALRQRGIGERLVRDAVDWLEQSGAETIEVYVAEANTGAQRFWRRIGGRPYLTRLSLDLPRARRGDR